MKAKEKITEKGRIVIYRTNRVMELSTRRTVQLYLLFVNFRQGDKVSQRHIIKQGEQNARTFDKKDIFGKGI